MSAERGNRRPLVSVLTPSFDQAQWLGDAIRSVQCQTYTRVEHIVMDGGSSDATLAGLKNARRRRLELVLAPAFGAIGGAVAAPLSLLTAHRHGLIAGRRQQSALGLLRL